MYSKTELALKYIRYYLQSSNGKGHGVHSPFVFEFITQVLNDRRNFYAYDKIEAVRRALLNDQRILTIEDFGAGSRVVKNNTRTVKAIAHSSLKPKKFSQLLFRMVDHYQPGNILELGTSLGITTSYLASANPAAKVITMEGAAAVAGVAKENFAKNHLSNVELVQGNFDDTLPGVINAIPTIDFAFLDGNHRYQPTIDYFQQVLQKSNDNTIIILDDIHWSKEMEDAWHWVQQHPQVTMSIDLFFIGIVLLKPEFHIKQHFSIRF